MTDLPSRPADVPPPPPPARVEPTDESMDRRNLEVRDQLLADRRRFEGEGDPRLIAATDEAIARVERLISPEKLAAQDADTRAELDASADAMNLQTLQGLVEARDRLAAEGRTDEAAAYQGSIADVAHVIAGDAVGRHIDVEAPAAGDAPSVAGAPDGAADPAVVESPAESDEQDRLEGSEFQETVRVLLQEIELKRQAGDHNTADALQRALDVYRQSRG